jgi:hypothetical protein
VGRVLIAIGNHASGIAQASRDIVPWNLAMMRRAIMENLSGDPERRARWRVLSRQLLLRENTDVS